MKTTKHLLEASSLVSESAGDDGLWKVRVISEGQGSSGIYTRELLERDHAAFNNVLSFRNHPNWYEGPQTRDFTMIAGSVEGETWVEQEADGRTAIFANYRPDPEYKEKLERYKDKLGLSVYIAGSGSENENGEFVVESFDGNDPYASLDVVIAPGARGRFLESADYMSDLKKMYAVREDDGKDHSGARQMEKKEIKMDEELKEALKGISEALAVLVADKKNADVAEAQSKADEAAVTSAVEKFEAAVVEIDKADLLPAQKESLRKAAKAGEDVAPLIENAKKIKEEAIESLRIGESYGRDFTSSANEDWTVAGVRV